MLLSVIFAMASLAVACAHWHFNLALHILWKQPPGWDQHSVTGCFAKDVKTASLIFRSICGQTFIRVMMQGFVNRQGLRRGGCEGYICGDQKMAPHVNKWSPLDGAHE